MAGDFMTIMDPVMGPIMHPIIGNLFISEPPPVAKLRRPWLAISWPSCTPSLVTFLFLSLLLQSCAGNSPRITASHIAGNRFDSAEIKGGLFVLKVYYRFSRQGNPIQVYIEGDGRAWVSKTKASRNPSPRNPVGLRLAVRDPGKNVMYIARPCQYVSFRKNPLCDYAYWTDKRFAQEVIDSISAVVDWGKKQANASKINVIGFSGGGAVAILVSVGRTDVRSIRTVAGNIDHKVWTAHHNVDPLSGSLNAADVAVDVSAIPQIHYVGARDKVIGRYVADSFTSKMGSRNCVNLKIVPGVTHTKGWENVWSKLIREETPVCTNIK